MKEDKVVLNVDKDNLVNEINKLAEGFNKNHKDTQLKPAAQFGRPEVIPTGIAELDQKVLVIGGLPRGRVVELGGEPSAGKTTLALNFCKQAVDRGLKVVYCENENTLDYEYGEKIGLNRDSYMIFKGEGLTGEQFLEAILELIESGFDVVVFDAINGVRSDTFIETDLKDVNMYTNFSQAKLTTEFKNKLQGGWTPKNKSDKRKVVKMGDFPATLVILNHLKMTQSGNKDTGGGEDMKLLYSIRLTMERLSTGPNPEKDENGDIIYSRIKMRTVKNKLAPPYRQCYLYLDNRTGQFVSDKKVLVELAERKGCITKSGAWVYPVDGYNWLDKTVEKWHGVDKFLEYLDTDESMKLFILGNTSE